VLGVGMASLIDVGIPVSLSAVSLIYCVTLCSSFHGSSTVLDSISADNLLVPMVLRASSIHSFRELI